jgi:hypothetical protein
VSSTLRTISGEHLTRSDLIRPGRVRPPGQN